MMWGGDPVSYKVVLLMCKTRSDFFEPKEDQAMVYPLRIAFCPKCGQPHTYTRDEVFETVLPMNPARAASEKSGWRLTT
jgi:hypothetical protein